MKFYLPVLLLMLFGYTACSSVKKDSLLDVLKTEIGRKRIYDGQKEIRIKALKVKLSAIPNTNYNAQYNICDKLYEEYKVYQFDSAYVYTQRLTAISKITRNVSQQYENKIKLGFILLSAGMFKETFDCLNQINVHLLSDSTKMQYYALKSRAYGDQADYNSDKYYTPPGNAEAIKYLDTALSFEKVNSFEFLINMGDKQIKLGQLQRPSQYYIKLLTQFNLTAHERAMVATGLSSFYIEPSQLDERSCLLAIGAINDIRSSTKETLAMFKLSGQLFQEGDIQDAYTFIQQALDDAQYYGARLRTIKIGAVLPVIGAQKNIKIEEEKNRFLVYFLSITAVALIVTLISVVIFIQLKKLRIKEAIIEDKNDQLEIINDKLNEDARIKEEYIGYFFNVISGNIVKLEKLKRSVERKLVIKKYEDISISFNEINIKKEREKLFYTFDDIFLKIFPNFIVAFNALFKEEDQIWPKANEVLNTDLRIFAFMRLGVSDNETIANILEYSVSTIYVYKMRIKAKAIVPGDQFDQRIMAIKSIDMLGD